MRKFVLCMLLISVLVSGADKRPFDTWESYAGGPDSSQYSSLKQINKGNVKQLQMAWSYPIGGGALTFAPVVVDRTMYVTKSGSIVALDAATGDSLWEQTAYTGRPKIPIHPSNSYATETPVTDGERVVAYFGMTGVYCYDLSGKLLWSKELGSFPTQMDWGTASSPVMP